MSNFLETHEANVKLIDVYMCIFLIFHKSYAQITTTLLFSDNSLFPKMVKTKMIRILSKTSKCSKKVIIKYLTTVMKKKWFFLVVNALICFCNKFVISVLDQN